MFQHVTKTISVFIEGSIFSKNPVLTDSIAPRILAKLEGLFLQNISKAF